MSLGGFTFWYYKRKVKRLFLTLNILSIYYTSSSVSSLPSYPVKLWSQSWVGDKMCQNDIFSYDPSFSSNRRYFSHDGYRLFERCPLDNKQCHNRFLVNIVLVGSTKIFYFKGPGFGWNVWS